MGLFVRSICAVPLKKLSAHKPPTSPISDTRIPYKTKNPFKIKTTIIQVRGKALRARTARASAARATPVLAMASKPAPQKVLMMGGTRFIGVYLARKLVEEGHEVHLLTRGKARMRRRK